VFSGFVIENEKYILLMLSDKQTREIQKGGNAKLTSQELT